MLIQANALQIPLPPESVHMIAFSPPYWGLRDYGTAKWVGGDPACDHEAARVKTRFDYALDEKQASNRGSDVKRYAATCDCGAVKVDQQLGLEPSPDAYISGMMDVMGECWRVLRDDGTCWVNLADSYAASAKGNMNGQDKSTLTSTKTQENSPAGIDKLAATGLKAKNLALIPFRFALAVQQAGWIVRQDIIWSKPNPMPESVKDRPTTAHEHVFLLAKAQRYFYDGDAIRRPHKQSSIERDRAGWNAAFIGRHTMPGENRPHSDDHDGFLNPNGANARSVWHIATQPYKGAHFATWPEKLVRRMIKAGTSEKGCCPECGAQWERNQDYTANYEQREPAHAPRSTPSKVDSTGWKPPTIIDKGWQPACDCGQGPIPSTVLDPFCGSGTTNKVARQLGRRAIGIDLSMEYLRLAQDRNRQMTLWEA